MRNKKTHGLWNRVAPFFFVPVFQVENELIVLMSLCHLHLHALVADRLNSYRNWTNKKQETTQQKTTRRLFPFIFVQTIEKLGFFSLFSKADKTKNVQIIQSGYMVVGGSNNEVSSWWGEVLLSQSNDFIQVFKYSHFSIESDWFCDRFYNRPTITYLRSCCDLWALLHQDIFVLLRGTYTNNKRVTARL